MKDTPTVVRKGSRILKGALKPCFALVMTVFLLGSSASAFAASSRTQAGQQDLTAVISASLSSTDAAMNLGNVVQHPLASQAQPQSLLSSQQLHVDSSTSGQALYKYSLSRVQTVRSWQANHSQDFSANNVWSTFKATSTKVNGSKAVVNGVEDFHVDSTVKSNGSHPKVSKEKEAGMAWAKKTGHFIDVGQTNHGLAQITHTITLNKAANGWLIQQDTYQDPLKPALQADHQTAVKKVTGTKAQPETAITPNLRSGFNYNRNQAISYANRWWNACNPSSNYNCYTGQGVDCANFVSQSIYDDAGGTLPGDNTWYSIAGVGVSNTFVNAPMLQSYMQGNFANSWYNDVHYAQAKADDINYQYPGDLIFYSWDGGPIIDHTAISVSADANNITQVNAHTDNVYHWYWDLEGAGASGRDYGATYWFVQLANNH